MYKIGTDKFILDLSPEIYKQDQSYSVNANLGVKVFSYGFSAETSMEVGVKEIAEFSDEIMYLYNTLTGVARLEEPYGFHNYIEFIAQKSGHIKVKGRLNNACAYGYEQEINFENEIDQTCIRNFSNQLFSNFSKYI